MAFAPELRLGGRIYLWTVSILGFLVAAESLFELHRTPLKPEWWLLAVLTLISGSASVKLPWAHVSISISEAFVFTAVLLYGPAAGTLTVVLDCLVISFWIAKRRPEFDRLLFNVAAPALSAWCSAHLFFRVSGLPPLAQQPATPATLNAILPALILFAVAYFGLNSWLITFVIAFEKRQNPWHIWKHGFVWLSLNYFCGASLAVLLVGYNTTIDLRFVAVVVPLLLVLYFTFKTSMERVEDANKHVGTLNALYLSSIETLAMAIDAKDQVTHGHIRRVQSYATRLAVAIGVKDEKLIKAIEAAALLHDMGKLAVPEYILNKPGKLTDIEFEKMKLHATVGADILSAISFPYPVVPIVRHHHECWDGSGYPSGKKGTDIPIGARILSVVDCFDALTSDRPYRPRLSEDEALRILLERRGTMYDPLIVDAFIKVHRELAPGPMETEASQRVLYEIPGGRNEFAAPLQPPVLAEIAASAEEMLTLYELARGLAGQLSLRDCGDVIANHLRRLIPASLCVFYLYHSSTDDLEAEHAVGEGTSFVRGLRIPLGQRLSGWVAANRQTISNSDPTLDLGEAARAHALRLRSCLSTPLMAGDTLIGVLSLYSGEPNGFNDNHRRVVEAVARQIGQTLQRATEFDRSAHSDDLTRLPHFSQLEQIIREATKNSATSAYALLFIEVVGLKQINSKYSRTASDEILHQLAQHVKTGLRTEDMLFKTADDDFIAFLNAADMNTADAVANRVRETLAKSVRLAAGVTITLQSTVTPVCSPKDGAILADLLTVARNRASSLAAERGASTIH